MIDLFGYEEKKQDDNKLTTDEQQISTDEIVEDEVINSEEIDDIIYSDGNSFDDETIISDEEDSIVDEEIIEDDVLESELEDEFEEEIEEEIEEVEEEEIIDIEPTDENIEETSQVEIVAVEDDSKLLEILEEEENNNKINTQNVQPKPFRSIIQPPLDHFKEREIDKLKRPDIKINCENFGTALKQLRLASNLTIESLSQQTCISKKYIEALEAENYAELPSEVYIIAYIRKLAMIYHLTNNEIDELTKKVRQKMDKFELEIPEEPEKMILGFESSNENAEKLKEIFWSVTIIIVITIVITFSVILFLKKHNRTTTGDVTTSYSGSKFRSEELIDIQETPILNENYIEIPK